MCVKRRMKAYLGKSTRSRVGFTWLFLGLLCGLASIKLHWPLDFWGSVEVRPNRDCGCSAGCSNISPVSWLKARISL